MYRSFIVPVLLCMAFAVGMIFWPEFFDVPSLLLTIGGSVTVTCFSYSKSQLHGLVRAVKALFLEKPQFLQDHVDELMRLTRLYRTEGLRGLENKEAQLGDLFLRQGVSMLVDLHREERIQARLEHEVAGFLSRYEVSRQILLTLGKLLPAFGLIGTLMGMVLLLRDFAGKDPQALTAALSMALLTTLYGAVLANVAVAPLAARLHSVAVEKEMRMRLTVEWVMMLVRGETATTINGRLTNRAAPLPVDTGRQRSWYTAVLSAGR